MGPEVKNHQELTCGGAEELGGDVERDPRGLEFPDHRESDRDGGIEVGVALGGDPDRHEECERPAGRDREPAGALSLRPLEDDARDHGVSKEDEHRGTEKFRPEEFEHRRS